MSTSSADTNHRKASARPVKRSFSIAGHKTSISLEAAFWDALRDAAVREGTSLAGLVQRIDQCRGGAGLSSAVRVWLLEDLKERASEPYQSG